jgi:hypothetical protein
MKLIYIAIVVAVVAVVSGCSKQESAPPVETPSTNAPAAP